MRSYDIKMYIDWRNGRYGNLSSFPLSMTRICAIIEDVVDIEMPTHRQETDFTCGPSVLYSLIKREIGDKCPSEEELASEAKSTEDAGTTIDNVVSIGNKYGLKMEKRKLSIEQLRDNIDDGRVVVINFQAWGPDDADYSTYDNGHFGIVVGHDGNGFVIEDPWLEGKLGYLEDEELSYRWHGGSGKNGEEKTSSMGIVVNKKASTEVDNSVEVKDIE